MRQTEMPVFTRTYDLLDAAFDLCERLEEANMRRGEARRERLERADEALARLRLYLHLAVRMQWLTKNYKNKKPGNGFRERIERIAR